MTGRIIHSTPWVPWRTKHWEIEHKIRKNMIQIRDFTVNETGQQHKARIGPPPTNKVCVILNIMMFYLSEPQVPLLWIINKNTWPKNNTYNISTPFILVIASWIKGSDQRILNNNYFCKQVAKHYLTNKNMNEWYCKSPVYKTHMWIILFLWTYSSNINEDNKQTNIQERGYSSVF